MKSFVKLTTILSVVAIIIGCNMGDVQSKDECLEDFFSKAQAGSWDSMYEEIHPDNPNRNNYKGSLFFSGLYETSVTYSVSSKSGDTYYVLVDPDGSGSGYSAATETFVFRAEEGDGLFEGDEWLIYSFTDSGTTY